MPTVTYKCPDTGKKKTKQFPYNAVGKAQAEQFTKLMNSKGMNATKKNNPGYGMEIKY